MSTKVLIPQFVATSPEQNGGRTVTEDNDENLARWIPKRVTWEDVPEFVSSGLRREGFFE